MKLDHVHIQVRDRARAADWLGRVLDLHPSLEFSHWAEIPGGPLSLSGPDGGHTLALFESDEKNTGDHTVAFRVDGDAFKAFVQRLPALGLSDRFGNPATKIVDHDGSYSVYFVDEDDNRFEVTTYDDIGVNSK